MRHRLVTCIALIVGSAHGSLAAQTASLPAAPSTATRPAHEIPFDLYDNRIYLAVSGLGFTGKLFLLDTGAQVTHFTSELVAQAGLQTAGRVGISGTGPGRVRGAYVGGTTLRIGSLSLAVGRGISAPAEALFGPVYSGSGRRFDGVLGYDLFAAFVVEIDYPRRLLRLYEPSAYRPVQRPEAQNLPIRIVERKPYVAGRLTLAGSPPIPVILHLDTGYGGVLSLNGGFVAQNRLVERVGETLRGWMRGVGGITEARIARALGLELGGIAIPQPIVSLALAQGAGVRADSAGRIGGEALRRFVITLDYSRRTMVLTPAQAMSAPFEADMSGLSLVVAGGASGAFEVANVGDDSPAAGAGLQPGDRLLSIDGRSATTFTLEEVRNLLRVDGATRRLRVARGATEKDVVLTLRRRL